MTTPRRRGRPGHDREAVLAAAVALFNERGYDATSISDVAARLGITKSSVYHHVRSKDELLKMAVDGALDALEGALDEVRKNPDMSAFDRLEALLRRSVHVLAAHLDSVRLLLRVHGNSPVEQAALTRRRRFDHEVTTLVKAAQSEGTLRPDADPATVARLLFGMVNSMAEWFDPARGNAATLATTVTHLAFTGLSTTHPASDAP